MEKQRTDKLSKLILSTGVFYLLALSISAISAESSQRTDDEILQDYAHLLYPPKQDSQIPAWNFQLALSNDGPEEDTSWLQHFTLALQRQAAFQGNLNLEYTTSQFDGQNELYFFLDHDMLSSTSVNQDWIWQVSGALQEYDASVFDDTSEFYSKSWDIDGGILSNWYPDAHIQLSAGTTLKVEYIEQSAEFLMPVEPGRPPRPTLLSTDHEFLLPGLYLAANYQTKHSLTMLSANLTKNIASYSADEQRRMQILGRLDLEANYQLLSIRGFHEYRFGNSSNGDAKHSLLIKAGGQHSFADRLIPQAQLSLGGSDTVRGYENQLVPGDEVIYAQGEYHLNNIFLASEFNKSSLYWFVDAGRAINFEGVGILEVIDFGPITLERESYSLLSSGVGLILDFHAGLLFKLEVGRVLKDISQSDSSLILVPNPDLTSADKLETAEKGDTALHMELSYTF